MKLCRYNLADKALVVDENTIKVIIVVGRVISDTIAVGRASLPPRLRVNHHLVRLVDSVLERLLPFAVVDVHVVVTDDVRLAVRQKFTLAVSLVVHWLPLPERYLDDFGKERVRVTDAAATEAL